MQTSYLCAWNNTKANKIQEVSAKPSLSVILFSCLLFAGSVWTLLEAFETPASSDAEYFVGLTLEGLYFAAAIIIRHLRRPIYMFEPYTIVTLVYILVYHVAAVVQLSLGDVSRYGVDPTRYAFVGCVFVIIGHMLFTLGYSLMRRRQSVRGSKPFYCNPISESSMLKVAYIAYVCSFLLFLLYQTSRGFSVSYILSGGISSETGLSINDSPLSFLAYCSYSLIGSWLMIFLYSKSKAVKIATYVPMLAILFFGGSRAPLLIPLISPVALIYIRRGKSPSLTNVLAAVALLVLLFAIMQVARVGIRAGSGLDLSGETVSSLFEPFYAEIDDFKVYYGLFGTVPDKHPFLLGSQMILASITILIPRAIWPGKPEPQIYDIINALYGQRAVADGVAYPNLGEYYVEFGFVGIVVCMFVFGLACRYVRELYVEGSKRSLSLVLYCLIYPALFQVIIRGYMPQNFTMFLFLLTPVVIAGIINKPKTRNRKIHTVWMHHA